MNTDLEGALRTRYGDVRKSTGKKGINYIITCPVCHKKRKCWITPSVGIYHCFRCDSVGSIRDLVGNTRVAFNTNIRAQARPVRAMAEPGVLVDLTTLADDHPATCYIHKRRFDVRELSTIYGVKYCLEGRKFAEIYDTTNTLIFPFWMDNKIVGWQSRMLYTPDDLTDEECSGMGYIKDDDGDWIRPPKYWTAPGVEKGKILYNHDWARQSQVVVICEGVFDAISVGRNAVATFGKSVTDDQLNMFKAYWDAAILLLDPGDALPDMRRIHMSLSSTIPTVIVMLKGYKDAGEAPRTEIWKQIWDTSIKAGLDLSKYRLVGG